MIVLGSQNRKQASVCPWFPEEGTVSLETWKKVGKQLQTYYSLHGPNRVPVDSHKRLSVS